MAIALTRITPVKFLLILYFHDIMAYYNRTYCWPTRAIMRRRIYEKTGRWYSLSWIDKCLYWLNENDYIESYFRPGKNADGTRFNRPSNRQLEYKALRLMKSLRIKVKKFLWKAGKKLSPPKDPTPITDQKPPDTDGAPPNKPGGSDFEDP